MTEKKTDSHLWSYWVTLIQLFTGEKVIYETLDLPLDKAVKRSRFAAFWASNCIFWCAVGTWLSHNTLPAWFLGQAHWIRLGTLIIAAIAAAGLSGVIGYGLLRLYTLVGHNLTTNLLKVRGQRLRLLSAQTTLLSLVPLLALGYLVGSLQPIIGSIIALVVLAYGVVLLSRLYNRIFHLHGLKGFWILLGGTLITWFVLATLALAVAVAAAVVGFVVLLILRGFQHTRH